MNAKVCQMLFRKNLDMCHTNAWRTMCHRWLFLSKLFKCYWGDVCYKNQREKEKACRTNEESSVKSGSLTEVVRKRWISWKSVSRREWRMIVSKVTEWVSQWSGHNLISVDKHREMKWDGRHTNKQEQKHPQNFILFTNKTLIQLNQKNNK